VTRKNDAGTKTHLLALTLVTAVVGLPIIAGRVLSGQDIVNYLIIAQQTAANLREGALLPAWAGGFNAEYGSPLLVFFPPLTGTVNAIPVLLGFPVINGVCSLTLVAHLFSGLAAYGWLRAGGARHAALPAAVVYMVAPYRLVDIYLRSALAENWAFIWPPLILWVGSDPRLRSIPRISLLALLVAALLLTNIPLAILFGIGISAWLVASKRVRRKRLQIVAGAALGFGIAAFMLVPQALAPLFLNLDVCFGPASKGLRPSANTLFSAGFEVWNLNTLFSLMLLSTFALIVLAYVLLSTESRKGTTQRGVITAALLCVFVTLGPVGPVWDALPILSKLQFPWRITSLLTLLAAGIVARLELRRAWLVAAVAVLVTVPFSGWDRTVPRSTFFSQEPQIQRPGTVLPDPHTAWEAGSGGWYWRHEYLVELCLLPKSMQPFMFDEFRGRPSSRLNRIRHRPAVVLQDPSAIVRVVEWGQVAREIEVATALGGTLMWRVLWFPGMEVSVDGLEVETFRDSTTGLTAHRLSPGLHVARWSWRPFPALRISRWISLAALALMVVIALVGFSAAGRQWRSRFRDQPGSK